jgi:hypothetical protein
MDVELQILKHLKRDARPTVSVIDQYCSAYNDLFSDVKGKKTYIESKYRTKTGECIETQVHTAPNSGKYGANNQSHNEKHFGKLLISLVVR